MGAAGCSGQVPQSCSDRVASWGGAEDELGFPVVPGCAIPGLPSACCAAFPAQSRGPADQDRVVLLPAAWGMVCEQGCQGDVVPVDTWKMHGAEGKPADSIVPPDDWSLPDEVSSMEGADDCVNLVRLPICEPPFSAGSDDREGDSEERSKTTAEAAHPSTNKLAEAVPVTDQTVQASPVVVGTDLDSRESLSVLRPPARGCARSISDREHMPALLVSGRNPSRNEVLQKVFPVSDVASKVAVADSTAASDATKAGLLAFSENSSVDAVLQQESQVRKASESLDEPSAATVPLEEPTGSGSPQQWAGIDRDSLHHISNMNLRPLRSRPTRQPSGVAGNPRQGGAARSSGGNNSMVLPALAAGAMGKRVEELLLW